MQFWQLVVFAFTYPWPWQGHVDLLLRSTLTQFQDILRYRRHVRHEPLPHVGEHCGISELIKVDSSINSIAMPTSHTSASGWFTFEILLGYLTGRMPS